MKYTLKDYWEANSSDERQKIVEWAFKQLEQTSQPTDESLSRMLGRIELGIDENEKPVFLSGRELKEIISIVNKWMKTKHTKEHWKYILGVDLMTKKKVIYIGNDCGNFAELRELPNHNFQQMKANAKLIAAAPELLEALDELLSEASGIVVANSGLTLSEYSPEIVEKAKQAIKKATN